MVKAGHPKQISRGPKNWDNASEAEEEGLECSLPLGPGSESLLLGLTLLTNSQLLSQWVPSISSPLKGRLSPEGASQTHLAPDTSGMSHIECTGVRGKPHSTLQLFPQFTARWEDRDGNKWS